MPTRESDKKPGSQPLPEEGESSQFTPTSKPTFEQSPVPFDQVTGINWYGNTEFAYHNRANYYSQVQGLHSGLDFVVLAGTPITSTVNRPGKVISVNGKPYNYKAGPGSILVDYGDFMVLYGHTSRSDAKVGDTVEPGQIVGYTGTDEYGTEHLHMEVIKKDPGWEALSQEKKAITRPGSVRTNPVPYLAPDLRKQLEEKQWGAFHPTADNKWQTPDDQPDIIPGKPYVI
jgi:murein DD-endopeptidase MepM/ murein hydrolase activator NlpD